MQKLRTRDKVALVITILEVVSLVSGGNGLGSILLGVFINLAIVYGVAAILDFSETVPSHHLGQRRTGLEQTCQREITTSNI